MATAQLSSALRYCTQILNDFFKKKISNNPYIMFRMYCIAMRAVPTPSIHTSARNMYIDGELLKKITSQNTMLF